MKNTFIVLLVAATTVPAPRDSTAQETAPPPTPQQVLEALGEGNSRAMTDAVAILTQLHERRPPSDLDAFADRLVALAIAGDKDIRSSALLAKRALIDSSSPAESSAVPYSGAYDALRKIFLETQSYIVLGNMIDVDLRRGKEVVRALLARHGEDACTADWALRDARNGGAIARELGVELGPISVHHCLHKYHDYQYRDVLAQLREGKAEGTDRAVDILTERASGHPTYIFVLADSLIKMAASGGGRSAVARRALAVLERSAHPVHADARPYDYAYEAVARVFRIAESQPALESLVEIDAARAREFLVELASRDQAVACKARGVLAGTADGVRLLLDLQEQGTLTYRCP